MDYFDLIRVIDNVCTTIRPTLYLSFKEEECRIDILDYLSEKQLQTKKKITVLDNDEFIIIIFHVKTLNDIISCDKWVANLMGIVCTQSEPQRPLPFASIMLYEYLKYMESYFRKYDSYSLLIDEFFTTFDIGDIIGLDTEGQDNGITSLNQLKFMASDIDDMNENIIQNVF